MSEQINDIQDTTVSSGDASGEIDVSQVVEYDTVYNAVYDATVDALAADITVTDGQTISSAALTFFEGILANQRIWKDYVVFVGDAYSYYSGMTERTAYEYCMVTGDLDCENDTFTGTGDLYVLRLSGNVGVTVTENQAVSLTAPMYYSRSNLGKYSGIIDRDWSGVLLTIMLALGGVVWFVKKLLRVQY